MHAWWVYERFKGAFLKDEEEEDIKTLRVIACMRSFKVGVRHEFSIKVTIS